MTLQRIRDDVDVGKLWGLARQSILESMLNVLWLRRDDVVQ